MILDVKKEILNLSSKTATRKGDIPAKILKNSINANLLELTILIHNCLKEGFFLRGPQTSRYTYIIALIFKREDSLNKEDYRPGPVSIRPHLSKVFERVSKKQIDSFMENMFSPYLCRFRKNHNAHTHF